MKSNSHFAFATGVKFCRGAVGEDNSSTAGQGSFVTLEQSTGSEFRAFVARPIDASVAVLIVHDYFGISDATKQYVLRLGALGYRSALWRQISNEP